MFRSKPVGLLVKILCIILVVYMALTFLHVRRQISDAKNAIETLTQQVSDQTQTNTELSNAIENRDDPSYIEDIAREKLGLVTSNDRVFYITD
jgi:cell division protein FtsL